ncbi:hypothetical protein GSB9_00430 [Flavobacteriaceae bacterium GSB9]|nr:hypothetical protein GSB9_00430 [Flavobacteriaceae bacterium GSB9]
MSAYKNVKNTDYQTDWAFNDDFTQYIHISDAKSGLNGYFCLGCKKEMQAAKGKIREHYFRHHAVDVDKDTTECVRANRKYRELLARDILHRLKEIKVPAVYKFPPKNVDGLPNQLIHAQTIRAHSVKSELTFYEDENCIVQYGQNPNINERYLLIRPDITFFNEKNEPILLIEFVVTHKIDDEKRVKLKRLGLNTVQIIIPKKPEPEIEKALKSQSKVKWVYNEIEANTNYIYIPYSTNNGVWEIDDEQRGIFEESYKCRANQISNLIRSVRRALDSESYKRAEHQFESEISRVETATKAEKSGLEDMERRIENEIRVQLAGEFQAIEFQEEQLNQDESEFRAYKADLERRYLAKHKNIRGEQESIDKLEKQQRKDKRTEAEVREYFIRETEKLERDFIAGRDAISRDIESRRANITELEKEQADLPDEFRRLAAEKQYAFESAGNRLEAEERNLPVEFGELEANSEREFRELEAEERSHFEAEARRLEQEESNLETTVRDEFYRAIENTPRELSKGISSILEARRVGNDFVNAKSKEQRYQSARELFRKGTWKTR